MFGVVQNCSNPLFVCLLARLLSDFSFNIPPLRIALSRIVREWRGFLFVACVYN